MLPSARDTPGRSARAATRSAGALRASDPVNPPVSWVPAGRTVTSGAVCRNRSVKLRFKVSVNTNVPATNATPSTIANALMPSRSLCAARPFSVALSIFSALRRVVARCLEVLHLLEHPVRGGFEHLVDDPAVGQEKNPVGVPGRVRVMGDHHHGLAELGDRATKEAEHLGAGDGIEVAGWLVGEE